jgi:hypothetical protein
MDFAFDVRESMCPAVVTINKESTEKFLALSAFGEIPQNHNYFETVQQKFLLEITLM